ncbi:hypothetical protein KKB55_15300 [Myxococcota bacterium]|nr:hypothetical protein [Myxococcota bacterium]
MIRFLLISLTLLPATSIADKRELSIRPTTFYRMGAANGPDDQIKETFHYGVGGAIGYGLNFNWSLLLQYQWFRSHINNHPIDEEYRYIWIEDQQRGLLGVAWTLSDEYTPLLSLESGLSYREIKGDHLFNGKEGDRLVGSTPDLTGISPVFRFTAAYEWRYFDYWSVYPGLFIEYDRAPSYGIQFTFAWYKYLNPRMWPNRPFIYSPSNRINSKRGDISAPRLTDTAK